MPRAFPAPFAAAILQDVVALSALVRLDRADGLILGFTNADAPIVFDGLTYEATEGIGASAIQSSAEGGVDNMDVLGVLSSDRITEDDLARGLYDGARITVRLVERALLRATKAAGGNDLDAASTPLLVGYLGDITVTDGQFTCQVRSLFTKLKQTIGDTTSKLCRVRRLGDAQCRLNMAGTSNGGYPNRIGRSVFSAAADGSTITFGSDPAPTDHYSWGLVAFTTGANAGVARDVKTHVNAAGKAVLSLRGRFPFPVAAGDVATIDVGCDRTIATCRTKFAHANFFHGEPDLPGNDALVKIGRG